MFRFIHLWGWWYVQTITADLYMMPFAVYCSVARRKYPRVWTILASWKEEAPRVLRESGWLQIEQFSRGGWGPAPVQDAGLLEVITVQRISSFFINRVSLTVLIKIVHCTVSWLASHILLSMAHFNIIFPPAPGCSEGSACPPFHMS